MPSSSYISSSDYSNNSNSERELFKTIKPYFEGKKNKFRTIRNVNVKKAIKDLTPYEFERYPNKEFDLIIQVKENLKNKFHTIIAIEVDGGEHIGIKKTIMLDREKENICKKHNIKLIRISNNDVKDYELIISLFETYTFNLNFQ